MSAATPKQQKQVHADFILTRKPMEENGDSFCYNKVPQFLNNDQNVSCHSMDLYETTPVTFYRVKIELPF